MSVEPLTRVQKLTLSLLQSGSNALARLDFDGIRKLAPQLGALLWTCLPARRRLAETNVRDCLNLSAAEARNIARESFTHTALSFLETVLSPQFGFEHPLFQVEDPKLLVRLQTTPAPVVITSGHMGAWELQAGLLGEFWRDSNRPSLMVVRRYGNRAFNEFMVRQRGSWGAEVLGHREAVFPVLKTLRRKGAAAFLVDHNAGRSEALFLPFLGRTAAVNMGPALLAVRAKAEIWPACILRQGEKYVLCQQPPLDTATLPSDRDQAIKIAAEFYTQAAERFIRRAPEQWFWMHNRWKTQEK